MEMEKIMEIIKPYEIKFEDIQILQKIPIKSSDGEVYIPFYKKGAKILNVL